MVPKTDKLDWKLSKLLVCADNALENFGDVSQVEGVVRLAGCGLHGSIQDLVVHLELSLNERDDARFYVRAEVCEESVDNRSEDHTDCREGHVCVRNDVEEALQSLCNYRSTTAWWAHC